MSREPCIEGYVKKSAANRGGMNAPWGITVDGDDNIWVGNFGPEERGDNFTTSNITKLAGGNPATRPPGLNTGDRHLTIHRLHSAFGG